MGERGSKLAGWDTIKAEVLTRLSSPGPSFFLWIALALLTSSPGLLTRTPYHDEILDTRLALLPIASQLHLYTHPEELGKIFANGIELGSYNPPLYHTLLHPILSLLGSTNFAMRSLSWLAGAVNVFLIYLLLSTLFPLHLAILGTFGFMVSYERVVLSQTARPHSLFLMFVLLSLLAFHYAERTGRRFSLYALALAAASHISYWGLLVVLPAQAVATFLLRRSLTHWHRAALSQLVAAVTALPYVLAILVTYQAFSGKRVPDWSPFTIAYFGTIFVEFAAATWGWVELSHLPWVGLVTLITVAVIARGIWRWSGQIDPFSRWLGLCFAAWFLILLPAYLLGASDMAGGPLLRKLALLQVALFFAFMFGVSALPSRLGMLVLLVWMTSTAAFGVKFMSSDYYRGSQLVAERVSQLPAPVQVYSNYHTSLSFLLETRSTSDGVQVFPFGKSMIRRNFVDTTGLPLPDRGMVCFSLRRDGGYLKAELDALRLGKDPLESVDTELNNAMRLLASRLEKLGWKRDVEGSYPGRVSFQLACFSKAVT